MSTLPDPLNRQRRVVVIDTRPLWRAGLEHLLSSELGMPVDQADALGNLTFDLDGTVVVSGQRIDVPDGVVCVYADDLADVAALALAVLSAGPARSTPDTEARSLTARERSVLRAVGRGLLATEIGKELGISVRTVERHRQAASAKLGARSPAQAVALALAQHHQ